MNIYCCVLARQGLHQRPTEPKQQCPYKACEYLWGISSPRHPYVNTKIMQNQILVGNQGWTGRIELLPIFKAVIPALSTVHIRRK